MNGMVASLRRPIAPLCDADAEAAVLSTLMLQPEQLAEVAAIIQARHFFHDANRQIFTTMMQIAADGVAIDVTTIARYLRESDRIDRVGGSVYLGELVGCTPAVANVLDHARVIADYARKRRIADDAERLALDIRQGEPLEAITERIERLKQTTDREGVPRKSAETISGVLNSWVSNGPLVHEPTGFQPIDELTGGGPVYGARWYFAGAPDGGKTALLVQLGHVWATRGIHVGFLAVDEEASDLVVRLVQRTGFRRSETELRDPATVARMGEELSELPIRMYGPEWTIESAAEDLHRAANGGRVALLIDSIQTVKCETELHSEREMAEVQAVTARTMAVRKVASQYRLIAIATSELGRASYANDEARRNTSTMAGGKWSGAIEYSARVLLGVRSVAGEEGIIDVEFAKNKHGPRDRRVYLKLDRSSQSLWCVDYTPQVGDERGDRTSRAQQQAQEDAEAVREIIGSNPGIHMRELWAASKASAGLSKDRVSAALAVLGDQVVRGTGPNRATPMTLKEGTL